MANSVGNILLGAAIASIVPVVTLLLNHKRWKVEKRVENLRVRYDRLERMYKDILARLPDAIRDRSYPSDLTSKISVYGSKEVRQLYFDHIEDKEKDDFKLKSAFLNISLAANKHLAEIEKQIEDALA